MRAVAFDTHSHLQDRKILDDFQAILQRAEAAGVAGIALCGYDAASNELAISLAAAEPGVFPTVGFHPHEADEVSQAMLAELEGLAALAEVVAVGEIGLDFYRGLAEEANQRRLLDAQLEIALRVGKPVSVHTRGAEDAVHEHLAPYAERARAGGLDVPGVMHCFGGTLEQALRYVELGFMVSIAGPITYPRNADARHLAAGLPARSLVVETDSPYLPPQAMRGKLNEPAHILHTAQAVAAARGESLETLLSQTTANAERLFRLRVPARAGAA
ncbi:MAG: TatD family hydrolase [Dehalococcoidia bacterium]|nr:TatD family hydrolase [Dehalococcoidia bacterium]